MTTFILIRHGQTDSNLATPNPRMSGWTDLPLNHTGLRQIERLRRRFAGESPAVAIYSSPLSRARHTAESIAAHVPVPIRLVGDLREINCGEVDGVPLAQVKQTHPSWWEKNLRQEDPDFRWPGGESYREMRERCLNAIRTLAAAHEGERVIVVTHAGVITQLLGAIHHVSPAQWEVFRAENTSLSTLQWGARPQLVRFNDHSHLHGLSSAPPPAQPSMHRRAG